jgi:secondary thiamine-phosphate synthase enzyme
MPLDAAHGLAADFQQRMPDKGRESPESAVSGDDLQPVAKLAALAKAADMIGQASGCLQVRAPSPGLHPITMQVEHWVRQQDITNGLLTLFCRHTSASLLVQENAAPDARRDLEAYFARIAPEGGPYDHDDEGPGDMPAHLRSALTQTHLSIPLATGRLALGTWQGIYLFEHRRGTPMREIALHLIGG